MKRNQWIVVALIGMCLMVLGNSTLLVGGTVISSSPPSMFQFDPLWNRVQERGFSLEEDGTFSLKIDGSQVTFPATLEPLSPIVIKTKQSIVKQFLGEKGSYRAELKGRYLIYHGTEKSILYRYESQKRELREFVYLPNQHSLDEGGSVIRWHFEGGTLKTQEDGSVAVIRSHMSSPGNLKEIADNNMVARISQFFKKRYASKEQTLFVIPKPIYMTTLNKEIDHGIAYQISTKENTLQLLLTDSSSLSFPVWADPSIQFDNDESPVIFNGQSEGDIFGRSVASAGDYNGDGKDDVIIGVPHDDNGGNLSGSAFVFFGGKTGTINNPDTDADVIISGTSGDKLGWSVASAGDFDGDGRDDIIIGAPLVDNHGWGSGAAYIFYGRDTGGVFLNPVAQADVRIFGDNPGDYFGVAVSSAGDFNEDGKDDVIVGAYGSDDNGILSGSAYIILGGSPNLIIDLNTGAELIMHGLDASDKFGYSVSSAGDFNGDGADDVIVGAYQNDTNGSLAGSAFVIYGGAGVSGVYDDLANQAGLIVYGRNEQDRLGFSVSGAGDFNGDGKDDIIIGAHTATNGPGIVGSVYIFYGGIPFGFTITDPNVSADIHLIGGGIRFGYSVASAGDFNGDGQEDVIIGTPGNQPNGPWSGSTYIFYGGLTSSFDLPHVTLDGEAQEDVFGWSVASAGDFNGDGLADIIAGAVYDDDNGSASGSAFIAFGRYEGSFNLTFDGTTTGNQFGFSVSSAGDFNADGTEDIIIGAPYNDENGIDAGAAYIFYGGDTPQGADVIIYGKNAGDQLGYAVSSAGDHNGDGKDDVIIGTPYATKLATHSGIAYVFNGGYTPAVVYNPDSEAHAIFPGNNAYDYMGISVSLAGDLNKDGKDEIIIGANSDDNNGNESGSAFIFYGPVNGIYDPDTEADAVIYGPPSSQLGSSVSSAGDFDADGVDDIIIGAYNHDFKGMGTGAVYIFFEEIKGTYNDPDTQADIVIYGETGSQLGAALSDAGDFNGDGRDDVILGARYHDFNGANAGGAYIFFGGTPPGVYQNLDSEADIAFFGQNPNDQFGWSVSGAGDFNGDGKDEVIVGAHRYNNYTGAAYVFFGGRKEMVTYPDSQADVALYGQSVQKSLGVSVSSGDFDGNGLDEVLIGIPAEDTNGMNSGSVIIVGHGFH